MALPVCSGQAQGMKGRPIEYAEPRNADETMMLDPKQSRLGSLESELNRPFESFNSGRSLDGVMLNAPLPAPLPVTRTSRDLSNKRLDWMYRSAEDLMAVDSVEDKYKRPELTPDGRDRTKMRPMERAYYEALEGQVGAQLTNQIPFGGSAISGLPGTAGGAQPGQPAFPGLPTGLSEALQRTLQNSSASSGPNTTDATDFSAFSRNSGFPSKPSDAELRRANDFMQIYNFSGSKLPTELPGTSTLRSSPYVNSSFYDLGKPQPQLTTPSPAASAYSSPRVSALAPVSPGAPIPPAAAYTPPAPQPVRSTTPVSPFMNVTRGGFQ